MAAIAVRRIGNAIGSNSEATVPFLSSNYEAIRHKTSLFFNGRTGKNAHDLGFGVLQVDSVLNRSVVCSDLKGRATSMGAQVESGLVRIHSSEGPPGQAAWQ